MADRTMVQRSRKNFQLLCVVTLPIRVDSKEEFFFFFKSGHCSNVFSLLIRLNVVLRPREYSMDLVCSAMKELNFVHSLLYLKALFLESMC